MLHDSTRQDAVRQLVVIVSAVIAVLGSFIGSGAVGGTPIQDAAGGSLAADATLIAPGGPAFAIWTPIYAGLLAYAVWQALPSQRADERQRMLGYWIAASLVLNAAWILSIQFDQLALSVPIIAALLVVLLRLFMLTIRTRPGSVVETIVVDGTLGLYLGWVCVATAANVAALLVATGFRGFGLPGAAWSSVVIAVAGIAGLVLAVRGAGRVTPTIALCWGLVWIAVGRLGGPLFSTPTAIAAIVAVAIVVVVTLALRLRVRTPRGREVTA